MNFVEYKVCKECWYQFNIQHHHQNRSVYSVRHSAAVDAAAAIGLLFSFLSLLLLSFLSTTQLVTFTNIFVCALIACLSLPFRPVRISQHLASPTSASCTFFWSFCYRFFCCSRYLLFIFSFSWKWWTKEAIFGILNEKVHAHTYAPIDSPKMNNEDQFSSSVHQGNVKMTYNNWTETKILCVSFFVFHLLSSIFPFDWNIFDADRSLHAYTLHMKQIQTAAKLIIIILNLPIHFTASGSGEYMEHKVHIT